MILADLANLATLSTDCLSCIYQALIGNLGLRGHTELVHITVATGLLQHFKLLVATDGQRGVALFDTGADHDRFRGFLKGAITAADYAVLGKIGETLQSGNIACGLAMGVKEWCLLALLNLVIACADHGIQFAAVGLIADVLLYGAAKEGHHVIVRELLGGHR